MISKNFCFSLPAGAVSLTGPLGAALKQTIDNRLKHVAYPHLVDPFRFRYESDGAWRCEFWGKIVRSAILAYSGSGDEALLALIQETVRDMIGTQKEDGSISSYPAELMTNGWDIWGRKYVLLGLIRYYEMIERDEKVKKSCVAMLDHLMGQVGPDKKNILECGWHDGLAASSILGAIVGVYRITGEKKYLDYAHWIADCGCSSVHNIYQAILDGVPPMKIGNGKAYEMMSCVQGLADLYCEDPDPRYLDIVLKFYKAVRDREIFITGVAGGLDDFGEYWCDGKSWQVNFTKGMLGETCITTTWLHFCERVLTLTNDAQVYDVMERSFYNGILGAVNADGTRWVHQNPTPLAGASRKIPSDDQIKRGFGTPYDENDCCQAQGPEGLSLAPRWAALALPDGGVRINGYENMSVKFRTPGGQDAVLRVTGGYPKYGTASIRLELEKTEIFPLEFRIPSWSRLACSCRLNGVSVAIDCGTYLRLEEAWDAKSILVLTFDLSVCSERQEDRIGFVCGPIVLAQDSRLSAVDAPLHDTGWRDTQTSSGIYLEKINDFGEILCDYASAGNLFVPENQLCVWMKQA